MNKRLINCEMGIGDWGLGLGGLDFIFFLKIYSLLILLFIKTKILIYLYYNNKILT
jgi:hypothetical protein